MGLLLMKRSKSWIFIRIRHGPSTYNLKAHPLASLVAGQAASQLLAALRERCRDRQLLQGRSRPRTDSRHVLGAIRAVNRLVSVAETMRQSLNSLAVPTPGCLRAHSRPEWLERYSSRVHDDGNVPYVSTMSTVPRILVTLK